MPIFDLCFHPPTRSLIFSNNQTSSKLFENLVYACRFSRFSGVELFATLCLQPTRLPCHGILQAGILDGCPPPGALPDAGMKPAFLTSPVLAGRFFTTGITWEAQSSVWGALIPTEIQRQAV